MNGFTFALLPSAAGPHVDHVEAELDLVRFHEPLRAMNIVFWYSFGNMLPV